MYYWPRGKKRDFWLEMYGWLSFCASLSRIFWAHSGRSLNQWPTLPQFIHFVFALISSILVSFWWGRSSSYSWTRYGWRFSLHCVVFAYMVSSSAVFWTVICSSVWNAPAKVIVGVYASSFLVEFDINSSIFSLTNSITCWCVSS